MLAAEIPSTGHVKTWTRARRLVDQTGRWPVVYWTARDWDDLLIWDRFDRKDFEAADRGSHISGGTSVTELMARAEALDLEALLEEEAAQEWKRKFVDSHVREALAEVGEKWGRTPPEAEVRQAAVEASDHKLGIERFLLEWELAQGPPPATRLERILAGWLDDLMTPPDESSFLLLLPTIRPWEVYAYIEGLWNRPSDRLVAAAHRWYERFGAECIAIWPGSVTQLHVERPPADVWTAWELARQHYLLAPDTVNEISLRDYARALVGAQYWELASRP